MSTNIPNRAEIKDQLGKILASSRFKGSQIQSELLRVVVRNSALKTPMNEKEIGFKIIPNYNAESHTVRSNASILREKLHDYYNNEGVRDRVLITLMPGASYRCDFTFRDNNQILQACEAAISAMKICNYAGFERALAILGGISFWQHPRFAPAICLIGECYLSLEITRQICKPDTVDRDAKTLSNLDEAESHVGGALQCDPTFGRAYLVKAMICLSRDNSNEARENIERAISIDKESVQASLWYAVYLWLVESDLDGANAIIDEKLRINREDLAARYLGCFTSYCEGNIARADSLLTGVFGPDEIELFPLLLHTLILMSRGKYQVASELFEAMESRDFGAEPYPKTDAERSARKLFCGLHTLALVLQGKTSEAELKLREIEKFKCLRPLEASIAYVAFKDREKALEFCIRAGMKRNLIAFISLKIPFWNEFMQFDSESDFEKEALEVYLRKVKDIECKE